MEELPALTPFISFTPRQLIETQGLAGLGFFFHIRGETEDEEGHL